MKPRRRILVVMRWPTGGIRTFLRYVFRSLSPERYRLTLIAPDYPELDYLLEDLREFEVDCRRVGTRGGSRRILAALVRELAAGRFDLIHSQGFTAGLLAALPARLSGTGHLMTSHDVLLESQFRGLKGRVKKLTLAALLPLVDLIHSVSRDAHANLLEHVPRLGRRPGRCVVVGHGVEVERFRGAPARPLREELGLGEDSFLIGFFGRFMSQKGFRYLVEAMEILLARGARREPYVLAFGYSGFIREEKEAIGLKGLEGRFRFMPTVPSVAGAMKGVDVVAMPSLWEACGLVAMEAMAAGVPLIGTSCIGLREVLHDTPAAVIPPASGPALAAALAREMEAPGTARALEFQATACRRFDVRERAREIEALYDSLMEGGARL